MIRGRTLAVAVLVALTVGGRAAANDDEGRKAEVRKCAATENLMIAIESDNAGLRESAAYLLGQFKCNDAVIPLMRILRNDMRPSTRSVAALALCMIGDARGLYAVKQAVRFDANPGVQVRCAWYYNEYVNGKTFAFVPVDQAIPAELATK